MTDITAAALLLFYFIAFAASLGALGSFRLVTGEGLRKLYHLAASLSMLILTLAFQRWETALFAISALLLLGYVLILAGSKIPFAAQAIDRGKGLAEVREHLLLMLLAIVLLLWVFWGLLGEQARFAAVTGMVVWGIGDAMAALVGSRHARRRYSGGIFDAAKSPLGTAAMVGSSAPAVWLILNGMTPLSGLAALLPALLASLAAGLAEAATRNGRDTLTVPLVAAAVVYPATLPFGLVGMPA